MAIRRSTKNIFKVSIFFDDFLQSLHKIAGICYKNINLL